MRVSIDLTPLAMLRHLNDGRTPDPLTGASAVNLAGADGVVCRLSPDNGNFKKCDIALLKEMAVNHLDVFITPDEESVRIVKELKPDQVTIVASSEKYGTAGVDVEGYTSQLEDILGTFQAAKLETSILVDPDISTIKAAKSVNPDYLTLDTRGYSTASSVEDAIQALNDIEACSIGASKLGMRVLSWGGLDHRNIGPIASYDTIEESILDYRFFARALFIGIPKAYEEIKDAVRWQRRA